MADILLSIDIGSASLRCALFTPEGRILAQQRQVIFCWHPAGRMGFNTDDIWHCLVESVNNLLALSSYSSSDIKAIGIDATASLVLLNEGMTPLPMPDNPDCDVYGWMDHRALAQAEQITKLMQASHPGQKIIPEHNLARVLWVKLQQPQLWLQCHCIMDLYDYLVWKLTGVLTATNCSLTRHYDADILKALDLTDMERRLHGEHLPIAAPVGEGLTTEAANQLELIPGTIISTGIVDGYGGSLATILGKEPEAPAEPVRSALKRLSMVVGTSTIYIATHRTPTEIPGAWGPIPSVLEGGYYHHIVGQSAAGILLDFVLEHHPAFKQCLTRARQQGKNITGYLNNLLHSTAGDKPVAFLTEHIHMLPYFAGNRCPRMDMSLTGMISGLRMDVSDKNLALTYLATLQAIALGARHNIETLVNAGYEFDLLTPCGGLAKNPLFVQEHCNVSGLAAALPEQPDVLLLSGALTASIAAGIHPSWQDAIAAMSRFSGRVYPQSQTRDFYNRKYKVFLRMYQDQINYKEIMLSEKT